MRALLLCWLLWATALAAGAQEAHIAAAQINQPDTTFHRQRREALRTLLPPGSVAVFFANPVRNRANDVDFHYHPDPDLRYLTGLHEPHAVLLLFKEPQNIGGRSLSEVLFVQPRNPRFELWNGKLLGPEGAKKSLGIAEVLPSTAFTSFPLNWESVNQILFLQFQNDVRDDASDPIDLYSLLRLFKTKANIPATFHAEQNRLHSLIRNQTEANSKDISADIQNSIEQYPELKADNLLSDYLAASSAKKRIEIQKSVPETKLNAFLLPEILDELRETKTPSEIQKLRRAIGVSAIGQVEVMKAMHPGLSETETQGVHEFVYRKYGLRFEGYPSIVGAGNNGCVLHYIENSKPKLEDGELILMDCGAEFEGYTADVTRTIPVNGKFSAEQKQIYELVLAAQEAGFAQCKVGKQFRDPHTAAQKVIAAGLVKLGIIKTVEEAFRYFPHGTSHYLGLDVHDRGTYGPFRPNTVITVEPGIYIPDNSPCDRKWWGIGVRIEDDILITEKGWENLSKSAPRTVAEIEATMAKPSALDDFVLPAIK